MAGGLFNLADWNNLRAFEPMLASNFCHRGKRLKEQARRVSSARPSPLATDDEKSSTELPLGRFFNEDRHTIRNRLSHLRILTNRGFGPNNSGRIPAQGKGAFPEFAS